MNELMSELEKEVRERGEENRDVNLKGSQLPIRWSMADTPPL